MKYYIDNRVLNTFETIQKDPTVVDTLICNTLYEDEIPAEDKKYYKPVEFVNFIRTCETNLVLYYEKLGSIYTKCVPNNKVHRGTDLVMHLAGELIKQTFNVTPNFQEKVLILHSAFNFIGMINTKDTVQFFSEVVFSDRVLDMLKSELKDHKKFIEIKEAKSEGMQFSHLLLEIGGNKDE